MKLSITSIKKIKKSGRYSDDAVTGLYLKVDKRGNKRWELRITIDGRRRDFGLGKYDPSTIDLVREKARSMSQKHAAVLEKEGSNTPLLHTVEDIVRHKHQIIRGKFTNEKHANQWIRQFEIHVFPKIGTMAVSDLRTKHVTEALSDLAKKNPETFRRIIARLKEALIVAKSLDIPMGEVDLEIVRRALQTKKPVKHFTAMKFVDVPEYIQHLRKAKLRSPTSYCLEFLILTACRTSEATKACWSEFEGLDTDNPVWVLPKERMKNRKPHKVPLTPDMVSILDSIRDSNFFNEKYVFQAQQSKEGLSNGAMYRLLRKTHPDLTVHGFRSSFRDWASETTEYDPNVCEMALSHSIGNKVEAAYRRGDLMTKRIDLANDWTNYLRGGQQ